MGDRLELVILECPQERFPNIGDTFDNGERLLVAIVEGGVDQAGRNHLPHGVVRVPTADSKEAVLLLIGRNQKLMYVG